MRETPGKIIGKKGEWRAYFKLRNFRSVCANLANSFITIEPLRVRLITTGEIYQFGAPTQFTTPHSQILN